jgi:chemotaxis protein CheD
MNLAKTIPATVYLRPGELYVADRPTVVTTILGSCVSVTMFSHRLRLGAICHALLPEGPAEDAFRFVDGSILHMLQSFTHLGISRFHLEIKMFGGADLLPYQESRFITVGRRNVEIAREVLKAEGLTLKAEDVGGSLGRKIIFHTHTGEVWLKRLKRGEFSPED